ncbi:DUF4386 domain-containing protein [Candidatus Margulisiibacteriota bacterium]
MNSARKTAIIVGIFYITATVAYSIAMILLDPILSASDFLARASENANQVMLGTLLVLVDAVAVAGIGIWMYQILKKHSQVLALGFTSTRIAEGIVFVLTIVPTLTLLTISQEFARAGALDASYYQTLGQMLLSAGEWIFLLGYGLVFAISALILNFVLYRTKFVPRWLSGWGFISAVFVLGNFFLQFYGIKFFEFLDFSIAIQEMVFALWLIIKGFNPAALAAKSA